MTTYMLEDIGARLGIVRSLQIVLAGIVVLRRVQRTNPTRTLNDIVLAFLKKLVTRCSM